VVNSFGDNAIVAIALGGVELDEGTLLDGAAIQPGSSPAGYTITVHGKGLHRVTMPFRVRVRSTSNHRELQFTAPPVLQSNLHLNLPGDWPRTQALCGDGIMK